MEQRRLRYRRSALFWSIPLGMLALLGLLQVVIAFTGGVGDVLTAVPSAAIGIAPLVLLWLSRVDLEPEGIAVVNGWRRHRLARRDIVDVRIEVFGLNIWRTRVQLRDGRVLTAIGLSGQRLAPGFAGRAPTALIELVAQVRRHLGLPL